ncbi:MAG: hypothetical protein KDD47_28205, partial [Acidobacteria bacterium]|nr:hypothetical protein [Acidobacteriota bacterium]
VKVVLWTDLGIPTLDFDVYLTGFDVFTANLRELFVAGRIPETGDQTSPEGPFSFPSAPYPDCELVLGGSLPQSLRQALISAHTGQGSLLHDGLCAGSPQGDGLVRGFLTVDVVRRCSFSNPTEAGYFGLGGVASYDNRLLGDFFFVDPANDFAQGENLVRLEADADAFAAGDRTFYGAWVGGDGSDGREPLPGIWTTRILEGGGFSGGTDLTVLRILFPPRQPFPCGGDLPRLPIVREVFSFDEEENGVFVFPNTGLIDPPPSYESIDPVPLVSQRIRRDSFSFFQPEPFGWVLFDMAPLPYFDDGSGGLAQAWVGSTFSASGRFSVGLGGSALSGACSEQGCNLGEPAEVGELCVLGRDFPGVPTGVFQILPGEAIELRLRPRGCFSSTCTQIFRLECDVLPPAGNQLEIRPWLCLATNRQEGATCTPDCAPDLRASCYTPSALSEGTYTARAGDLELTFEVPSTVPADGLCVGEPF